MKQNHPKFGRGAQTLSFLILSSVILLCFAQARRIDTARSAQDFITPEEAPYSATEKAPQASLTMGDLSVITITLPNPSKTFSRTVTTTTKQASSTASKTKRNKTTTSAAISSTTTTTTKASATSKTTATTPKVTATSKTTTTSKVTATSKATTTSEVTTTSKATTTTKDHSNIPPNQYNESKYYIVVYTGSQSTVVYGKDDSGNYTRTIKTFTCSTGADSSPTRTGTYKIRAKYRWRYLVGGVYGQYNSSISRSYLFHSVPYYKQDASTLENEEYDKLGTPASKGCIRMCVRDCKWIYDNCPIGTEVNIVNQSGPSGPGVPKRSTDSAYSGWDPSDRWAQGNPYFA